MADNTDLLTQFRQIVREENEPLREKLDRVVVTQQEQGATQTRLGNLLSGITGSVATLLEEHSAQRSDIRSLHTEVHATGEELKEEIHTARDEAQRNTMDLKATVIKQLKDHDKRIEVLEDAAGIPNPNKH
jgi:hypothetical protein